MNKTLQHCLSRVILGTFFSLACILTTNNACAISWLRGGEEWVIKKRPSDIRLLAERAQDGDVEAMRTLGLMSIKGIKVKQSTKIALQWWRKAAQEDDVLSIMYIGDVYRTGKLGRKNYDEAMQYYVKAYNIASESSGHKENKRLITERIQKLPLDTSLSWWKSQCKRNNEEAMYYLASLKKKQRKNYLSDEDAADYMVQAALRGHPKAIASIENNKTRKYKDYWERMLESDDSDKRLAAAQFIYNDGDCSSENEIKAIAILKELADEGNDVASDWMSDYYKKATFACEAALASGDFELSKRYLTTLKGYSQHNRFELLTKLISSQKASAVIVSLLLKDADVIDHDRGTDTPLLVLAIRNKQSVEVLDALIISGLDVNQSCAKTGETPLIAAVKSNDVPSTKLLLEQNNIDIAAQDHEKKDAIAHAPTSEIKELLQYKNPQIAKAKQQAEPESEESPFGKLEGYIRQGNISALSEALDEGISPSLTFPGYAEIWRKAVNNKLQASFLANLLLDNAQFNQIIQLSTEKNINPFVYNFSLLHIAAESPHTPILELLIARGANVNEKSNYGHTALFAAASSGNLEHVKLLLEKGAEESLYCPIYLEACNKAQKLLHSRNKDTITALLMSPDLITSPTGNYVTVAAIAENGGFAEKINQYLMLVANSNSETYNNHTQQKTTDKTDAAADNNLLVSPTIQIVAGIVVCFIIIFACVKLVRKKRNSTVIEGIDDTADEQNIADCTPTDESVDVVSDAPSEMPPPPPWQVK